MGSSGFSGRAPDVSRGANVSWTYCVYTLGPRLFSLMYVEKRNRTIVI